MAKYGGRAERFPELGGVTRIRPVPGLLLDLVLRFMAISRMIGQPLRCSRPDRAIQIPLLANTPDT